MLHAGKVSKYSAIYAGNDTKFYLQGLTEAALTPETGPAMTAEPSNIDC